MGDRSEARIESFGCRIVCYQVAGKAVYVHSIRCCRLLSACGNEISRLRSGVRGTRNDIAEEFSFQRSGVVVSNRRSKVWVYSPNAELRANNAPMRIKR